MATLEERKAEYDLHKSAGYDFYNTMRATLSLQLEAEAMTAEQVINVQMRFVKVKDELLQGDWKNALLLAQEVLPNEFVSQAFIDDVRTQIQDYITNNYTW